VQADAASQRFGYEFAVVAVGSVVNEDASLGKVYTSPGLHDVRGNI
jgi:hypothetical protein